MVDWVVQVPFDATVRISLDTNLAMIKENVDGQPVGLMHRYTAWCPAESFLLKAALTLSLSILSLNESVSRLVRIKSQHLMYRQSALSKLSAIAQPVDRDSMHVNHPSCCPGFSKTTILGCSLQEAHVMIT